MSASGNGRLITLHELLAAARLHDIGISCELVHEAVNAGALISRSEKPEPLVFAQDDANRWLFDLWRKQHPDHDQPRRIA